MADRDAEELVAEWSSDLEAVLYQPEVEEAIREVSLTPTPYTSRSFLAYSPLSSLHILHTLLSRLSLFSSLTSISTPSSL